MHPNHFARALHLPKSESIKSSATMVAAPEKCFSHTHLREKQFVQRNLASARSCTHTFKKSISLISSNRDPLRRRFFTPASHNGAIAAGARDFASFRQCVSNFAHALRGALVSVLSARRQSAAADRIQKANGVMEKRVREREHRKRVYEQLLVLFCGRRSCTQGLLKPFNGIDLRDSNLAGELNIADCAREVQLTIIISA
jgi:hypothetical protein